MRNNDICLPRSSSVINSHTNTGTKAIWALINLYSLDFNGFQARDVELRRHRGLIYEIHTCYDDDDDKFLDNCELIYLAPGRSISRDYTFPENRRPTARRGLLAGRQYEISLKKREWQWVYEDGLPEHVKDEAGVDGEWDMHRPGTHGCCLS